MHKVMKNLLEPDECAKIAERIRNEPGDEGDIQCPTSRSHYGLPATNTLLGLLCSKISDAAQKQLKPTYSYCRVYRNGSVLAPHKDRPSCEYSVTLNLSQTHPWTIYMGRRPLSQNPGDGILYEGCKIEHSRKAFKGDEYIQVFLHYVDANGPYKDHVYDLKTTSPSPVSFMFARENHNLTTWQIIPNAFSVEECQSLINSKFKLTSGMVEGGNLSKRRSQIYWIPKTTEWIGIYESIMKMVGQVNKECFDFDITSLHENIQFTEYHESYQGHYDWHLDIGWDVPNSNRKLSVVVQLSDPSEYEGGDLQFQTGGEDYQVADKKQGACIIFPSYLRHRVTPVTRGCRRSLVTWITGSPFR